MEALDYSSRLSISKQSYLLSIPRSTIYYKPRERSNDTYIANEIYELWMKYPFYGYRRITEHLRRNDYEVNHKKVQRLMKLMNLEAIYPKRTTIPGREDFIYPYLLDNLEVIYPNQVWSTDITYIKMQHGFIYLVALIDLYSRYIVSWKLSITMDVEFCLTMLEQALSVAMPLIINSDQGCQFTSLPWTSTLLLNNIQVSMDGKGRWIDNVFIERFWRSIKQEEVYIKLYESVTEARGSISEYIEFYNYTRPHQSLGYKTPAELYFNEVTMINKT